MTRRNLTVLLITGFLLSFTMQHRPTVYLIGDSTVRNDNKVNWGWGSLLANFLDTTRIQLDNQAMAGRSTRTFRTEGRWDRLLAVMKPGDYLLIQFGHNEGSPPDTSRQGYRGVLKGIGKDSLVLDWGDNKKETVYSYGENLRRFVLQAKAFGVQPIILSMIPRNQWDDSGTVKRADKDYALWARQIAEEQQIPFIDLNEITARRYEELGQQKVKEYFPQDHTHTNYQGALLNARSVIQGLLVSGHTLVNYIRTN